MNHPLVTAIVLGVTGIAALLTYLQGRRRLHYPQNTLAHNSSQVQEGLQLEECPICRVYIKPNQLNFKLRCGHNFHKKCLAVVFEAEPEGYRSCPSCRRHIPDANADAVLSM